MKEPVAGPEGGKKRGAETAKNRHTGADQDIGPAGICRKIGDFVRIMANLRKRQNTKPPGDAKKIPKFYRQRFRAEFGMPTSVIS
ncbi:MAG: hypothetical protein NTW21_15595 [Verrucomicrobia bacterium]|nr:hypothetical protein [Verrucomicrobiota bacterium]